MSPSGLKMVSRASSTVAAGAANRLELRCPVSQCPQCLSSFSASIAVSFVVCGHFKTQFVDYSLPSLLLRCSVHSDAANKTKVQRLV